MSKLAVFGETTNNNTDSKYTYANVVTLEFLEMLSDDIRFENINQADVVNLALMLLDGVFKSNNVESKEKLCEMCYDVDAFKTFAINTINYCRLANQGYNISINEFIEQRSDKCVI